MTNYWFITVLCRDGDCDFEYFLFTPVIAGTESAAMELGLKKLGAEPDFDDPRYYKIKRVQEITFEEYQVLVKYV